MKFHLFVVLEEVLHETSTAVGEKKKKRSIRTANLFYLILMRRKTKKKKNIIRPECIPSPLFCGNLTGQA